MQTRMLVSTEWSDVGSGLSLKMNRPGGIEVGAKDMHGCSWFEGELDGQQRVTRDRSPSPVLSLWVATSHMWPSRTRSVIPLN